MADLKDEEIETYKMVKEEFKHKYLTKWRQIIQRECRYKNPVKINYEYLEDKPVLSPDDLNNKLYVFPCFMKPGKHYYTVRTDPKDSDQHIEVGGSSLHDSFDGKF